MAKVVSILGPPGAGKGTQAGYLVEYYGMVTFSMGQALRDRNDPALRGIVRRGELVPAQVTVDILFEQLESAGSKDVVVDGFPRMMEQVRLLEPELKKINHTLVAVLHLVVSRAESEKRLKLRGRADDTAKSIEERWRIYENETAQVLDYYRRQGLVKTVNGEGLKAEVSVRVERALGLGHAN